jgi:O-antigen biosynthesis protein
VIRDLMCYFRDSRYVRVDGRPLLLIYRVELFPDFANTAATWRDLCRREGVGEIYLAMVESFDQAGSCPSPAKFGCNASVQFPPHGFSVSCERALLLDPSFEGAVFDYEASLLGYLRQPLPAAPRFSAVMPSWDNTARRMERATIFHGSSPGTFQAWLEAAIRQTREHNFGEERIVFINAWNEWAEGTHLEPDQVFGHGYLEAVRNALAAHRLRRG